MKFNYFKTAKRCDHVEKAFGHAFEQKYEHGEPRYMAAVWLAWAYYYQHKGDKRYVKRALRYFLEEISMICGN